MKRRSRWDWEEGGGTEVKRHSSAGFNSPRVPSTDELRRLLLRDSGWPMELLSDPKMQPRVVSSAEEFADELMFGEHMDEVVVLKGGCELLQQQEAVPTAISSAIQGNTTVRGFLDSLSQDTRKTHNARIYHLNDSGRDTKQLRKDASGREMTDLEEKMVELARVGPKVAADESMYIAELRRTTKFRHLADGGWAKTALTTDVKDFVGVDRAALLPYWDRFDEGVFVGGRHSGSAMHVDQVGWSNVGA